MNIFKKLKSLFIKPKKAKIVKFGWKKDKPDPRDIKFKIVAPHVLPPKVDLRPYCPPVYNQEDLGSCTSNSLAGAYQFEQMKQKKVNFVPSRLFIYYNERVIEGTVDQDAGAMIRDGIKTMVSDGVCPESMWKYITGKFAVKPPKTCYDTALNNQVLQYLSVNQNLYEVKHCLSEGYPIAFGFTVYDSLMTDDVARLGMVPMPTSDDNVQGGHAVLAVGYDDTKECLIVRNSWGAGWGLNGYFYLPYGFITNPSLSSDFWTIRLVE